MTSINSNTSSTDIQKKHISSEIESEVLDRYAAGAQAPQASLCCPTDYDDIDLKLLPQEIIEKDYGCGDPSKYVHEGETALDLGSGGGKICYILSQKVGKTGNVIGVDFNDTMLSLARKYQNEMSEKYGYSNVSFHKGKIQDLALSLDQAQKWLEKNPIKNVEDVAKYEAYCDEIRKTDPLIKSNSIDVIVSNCVLNLVKPQDKKELFKDMFRVLKRGGRCVISDIVCDEFPTDKILEDPELWSGCISGAFREDEFLEMFAENGFYGIQILERQAEPWQTIDGIEFRSLTVQAYKGKEGPCLERHQAAIYKGPWKSVKDDDGHTYYRGQRMAVCDKTLNILTDPSGPYSKDIIGLEPAEIISLDDAEPMNCRANQSRNPKEMKKSKINQIKTIQGDDCSSPNCC